MTWFLISMMLWDKDVIVVDWFLLDPPDWLVDSWFWGGTLVLISLATKGLLELQGRHGIASVVRWNLRPVNLRCRKKPKWSLRGSLRGSWRTLQKESKMSLRSQKKKTGDFWLEQSPGGSFLTLFGGGPPGPLQTLSETPRRLLFDFLTRGRFWHLWLIGGIATQEMIGVQSSSASLRIFWG